MIADKEEQDALHMALKTFRKAGLDLFSKINSATVRDEVKQFFSMQKLPKKLCSMPS